MELLQDVKWIFTVAGVLLIIAAVFEGGLEIREIKIPKLAKGSRILSALAGIGFIVLGMFPITPGTETDAALVSSAPREIESQIQTTIDNPQAGEEVPSTFTVNGTVSAPVPEGYSLWIVMEDDGGEHYSPKAFKPLPDGTWEERIQLGSAWHGRESSILVVQVEGNPPLESMLENQEVRNVFQLDMDVDLLAKRTINVTGG